MRILWISILSCGPLLWGQATKLQTSAGDWPMYSRDLAGTRYSPLAQIDAHNVAKLTQAWSRKLRGTSGNAVAEVTPIGEVK
jgi:glucose dehydrogenase